MSFSGRHDRIKLCINDKIKRMKELLITFSSLIVTGLGSLSYTHPRFAIKLLSLLLMILISVQTLLSGYRSVWTDNQIMTERGVIRAFLPFDSLINIDSYENFQNRAGQYKIFVKEHKKIKESVNQILLSSSDRIKNFNENCDYFLYIAYAVIVTLGIFSFQFSKYKANRNSKEE